MSNPCSGEGDFRGEVIEQSVCEAKTGAIGISLTATCRAMWNPETQKWDDITEWDMTASGTVWVIGKDGNTLAENVERLCKYLGWDAVFDHVVNGQWNPKEIQFTTRANEYKGQVSYPLNWINEYGMDPSFSVSPEKLRALDNQHGSKLRAIAGNAKRNASAPAGRPEPPRGVTRKPKDAKYPDPNANPVGDETAPWEHQAAADAINAELSGPPFDDGIPD